MAGTRKLSDAAVSKLTGSDFDRHNSVAPPAGVETPAQNEPLDENEAPTSARALQVAVNSLVTIGGRQMRIARRVTRTSLSLVDHVSYAVRFEGSFYEAEPIADIYNPKKLPPPWMANVVDLETGECMTMMCNTVLRGELDRQYPDDDYVGRSFVITRKPATKEEKLYKLFDIVELVDVVSEA